MIKRNIFKHCVVVIKFFELWFHSLVNSCFKLGLGMYYLYNLGQSINVFVNEIAFPTLLYDLYRF